MNDRPAQRPTRKAVRSQQVIFIWLTLWVVIGLGLFYSSYILYRDMGGFDIGVIFLLGSGLIILVISLLRNPKELRTARELERAGINTARKVTEKWIKKHRGKTQSKSYFIAY